MPKAKIFDALRRTDMTRKKLTESIFAYLNRSAQRGSVESRALMETWLSRVPASEHAGFCARIRCGNESEFTSALQELMLRELLRRQRCKIEFHPNLPGATKQLDFKVRESRNLFSKPAPRRRSRAAPMAARAHTASASFYVVSICTAISSPSTN